MIRNERRNRLASRVALASTLTAALVLGLASVGAAGPGTGRHVVVARPAHSGSLLATGIGAFDYWFQLGGQSYNSVKTTGTLSGFRPHKTYYVYDNDNESGEAPAAIRANAKGQLVFDKNLGLLGPDGPLSDYAFWDPGFDSTHPFEADLRYYLSTDPDDSSTPPDHIVYRPPTRMTVNPMSNPWTADGGTSLVNYAFQRMSNGKYTFGAVPGKDGFDGTGNYGLFVRNRLVWSTHTSGGTNNRLVMQRNGNLVIYNATTAIWQSHTRGHPGAYLLLQADRNLVIYSSADKALWQSGTYVKA